jgi:hypothetical protein
MERVRELFSGYKRMIVFSRNKKDIYMEREEDFLRENRSYLQSLLDREGTDREKADRFVNEVVTAFGWHGKVSGTKAMDLGFFMLYYVFPSFLKIGGDEVRPFLDALRDRWNQQFRQNITYSDYNEICSSFHDTFLGFRIPNKDD